MACCNVSIEQRLGDSVCGNAKWNPSLRIYIQGQEFVTGTSTHKVDAISPQNGGYLVRFKSLSSEAVVLEIITDNADLFCVGNYVKVEIQ